MFFKWAYSSVDRQVTNNGSSRWHTEYYRKVKNLYVLLVYFYLYYYNNIIIIK